MTLKIEGRGRRHRAGAVPARERRARGGDGVRAEGGGRPEAHRRAAALPGEPVTENNSREFIVRVMDPRIRVLIVEGVIRSEYRFLRKVLGSDPTIEVTSVIKKNKEEFYQQDSDPGIDLSRGPAAEAGGLEEVRRRHPRRHRARGIRRRAVAVPEGVRLRRRRAAGHRRLSRVRAGRLRGQPGRRPAPGENPRAGGRPERRQLRARADAGRQSAPGLRRLREVLRGLLEPGRAGRGEKRRRHGDARRREPRRRRQARRGGPRGQPEGDSSRRQ